MDFDFSELDPEIEKKHFQNRFNALLKIMYEDDLPYPFDNHLRAIEKLSKETLRSNEPTTFYAKQSALINLKVVEALRKEYEVFKLISQ